MDENSVSYSLAPLGQEGVQDRDTTAIDTIPPQRYNLYISHALTTWNARTYEYAAVRRLFLELHGVAVVLRN